MVDVLVVNGQSREPMISLVQSRFQSTGIGCNRAKAFLLLVVPFFIIYWRIRYHSFLPLPIFPSLAIYYAFLFFPVHKYICFAICFLHERRKPIGPHFCLISGGWPESPISPKRNRTAGFRCCGARILGTLL